MSIIFTFGASAACVSVCSALQKVIPPQEVAVIANPSDLTEKRVFVRYEIPGSLLSADIVYAQLMGKVDAFAEGKNALEIEACPVMTDWNAGVVSWEESWDEPGGDFDELASRAFLVRDGRSDIRIDVTEVIRQWVSGERDNFGLMVKPTQLLGGRIRLPVTRGGGVVVEPLVLKVYYMPASR